MGVVSGIDPRTWPGFERLTAALQRKLDPSAAVQWNEFLDGRSGTRRQLDVTVRGRLGATDVLVVVECKDYREKVGIEFVEAFIAKLEDVGGNKGVMVAKTGFTRDALARAERAGIVMAVLRPARDEDWEGYLRSMRMEIVSRVVVIDDISVVLADGRELHVSAVEQVEDHLGQRAFLDSIINGWLHTHPWDDGVAIKLTLDPHPRLLRDDEEPQVAMIRCRPRWDDGVTVEADFVRPEDWVFVRYFADGRIDDERHFFEFDELQRIANTFLPSA